MQQCDRQTDGRTDRFGLILSQYPVSGGASG